MQKIDFGHNGGYGQATMEKCFRKHGLSGTRDIALQYEACAAPRGPA